MKVLHLISSLGMYGAEAIILTLCRTLNDTGVHSGEIAAFANSTQPNLQLYEAAKHEGIRAHLIDCKGQIDFSVARRIRTLADSTGADIIHAHGYKTDVYLWLALRSASKPLVSTCHTWYDNDLALRFYGMLDRMVLRSFAGVVAVSDDVRNRLLAAGVRQDRIRLIRNGIATDEFEAAGELRATRSPNQPLRIGLVGRLSREKGIDLFLRAAAEIWKRHPGTSFAVAGDGPDRAALENLIHDLGLEGTAVLVGRTDNMPAFYSSIDVLVSSSRNEGLPVAMLEAMASGLPLVATAVGAVPQIIENGRSGLLVNAGNIEDLAAAVCKLIDDPSLRAELGKGAQQRVRDEFSAGRMAAEYINLYERVLAERN